MISIIFPLEQKLLFTTKQGVTWRLKRAEENDPKRRERINLIISLIEDDKTHLKQKIEALKGTLN